MIPPVQDTLRATASTLVEHPRGIVALDGAPSASNSFGDDGVFQQLIATTPDLHEYVNGVVLPSASLHRPTADGRSLPRLFNDHGLLPGMRADGGEAALIGSLGELVTSGVDGLTERMAGFARAGVRFITCRSRTMVGSGSPSVWALRSNANALARFARTAQETGIVPVLHCGVGPEGSHCADRAAEVLAVSLTRLFCELDDAGVDQRTVVLSPGLAFPGLRSRQVIAPAEIGLLTVEVLRLVVPAGIAGVAVHAAGQDLATAVEVLAAAQDPTLPWPLTFCFGRTLIKPAARAWHGRPWLGHCAQAELARGVEQACMVLRPARPRLRIA